MPLKSLRLNSRGDTIVEVMIVLAILGLAISIAYSTANRSLMEARQAQENSYAAEQVLKQIEAIRDLGQTANPTPGNNIFITSRFCVTYSSVLNSYTVSTAFVPSPPPEC